MRYSLVVRDALEMTAFCLAIVLFFAAITALAVWGPEPISDILRSLSESSGPGPNS
jgi:hypothetical protein